MKFTIIIPCYQQAHHLRRCVASVLPQLRSGDRVVIVDDGNPEPCLTAFRLGELPKNAVTFVRHETNQGVSAARNAGLRAAPAWAESENEWVKFLDADDELAPHALNTFRAYENQIPAAIQVVSGLLCQVVDGVVTGFGLPDWNQLKRQNPALLSPTFIRRSAVDAVSGFDERLHFEEDWDLWLKLERKFGVPDQMMFTTVSVPICYYWIDQQERAAKQRDHTVEGQDVREYFRETYGITPA